MVPRTQHGICATFVWGPYAPAPIQGQQGRHKRLWANFCQIGKAGEQVLCRAVQQHPAERDSAHVGTVPSPPSPWDQVCRSGTPRTWLWSLEKRQSDSAFDAKRAATCALCFRATTASWIRAPEKYFRLWKHFTNSGETSTLVARASGTQIHANFAFGEAIFCFGRG